MMNNWCDLGVPDEVLKSLEEQKFYSPTEIQRIALPAAIRDRKDILGAAATGTGKTLAFGVPMISRILKDKSNQISLYEASEKVPMENESDNEEISNESAKNEIDENDECDLSPSESELDYVWKDEDVNPDIPIYVDYHVIDEQVSLPYQHIYGLVLTPTRELAVQVADHLRKACKYTGLNVEAIFGGMSIEKQERKLKKRPDILVVTPGRFWSFIKDENPAALSAKKISVLVIDEADRMIEKGHFQELEYIMNWLSSTNNTQDRMVCKVPLKQRQNFLFSATLTFVHDQKVRNKKRDVTKDDKLKKFITDFGLCEKPKIIDMSMKVSELYKWQLLCPDQESKDSRLFWFLSHHQGRCLIFTNSQNSARRLRSVLQQLGILARCLSAHMKEKDRLRSLEGFSRDPHGVLVATDVAARGLDIVDVDYVVHFDMAYTAETYVHRTGRTARANRQGHSVVMWSPNDVLQLKKIDKSLKKTDAGDLEQFQKINYSADLDKFIDVTELARNIECKSHKVKTNNNDLQWFEKMATEMEFELDDKIKEEIEVKCPNKKEIQKLKADKIQLKNMLHELQTKFVGKFTSPIHEIDESTKRKVPEIKEVKKKNLKRKLDAQQQDELKIKKKNEENIGENLKKQSKKKKRKNKNKNKQQIIDRTDGVETVNVSIIKAKKSS